jgi:Rrf2 family protein
MRTISKRTQYGLKAMLALGSRYGEGPILIATLSQQEAIPIKFLELILLDLKSSGLLVSKKGPKGGYQLSRPPS